MDNKVNVYPPFFSVIIPTYNRNYCILDAIESVLNQTFVSYELIIVDDASSDNTFEIIENINDQRIKYVRNEVNKGQSASLNVGAGIAKGKYLAFLDSDDLWECNFLSSFILKINQLPNIHCFYCWLNTEVGIYKNWRLNGNVYSEALFNGELSSTITLVVSKYAFDKVSGFDESFTFGNDDDICFRLSKEFEFSLIPEPLAFSRALDINAMTKNGLSLANGKRKLLEKYEKDIQTLLGRNKLARKYYELSNNYLLAGDLENFKYYLNHAIMLRFKRTPVILRNVLFNLNKLYKFRNVRKGL
jgi:glycosyltransferase involved in cell wall biosynthesis